MIESLPDQPLLISSLDELEQSEGIKSVIPMFITGVAEGQAVFNFVLETKQQAHALVLRMNGEGWTELDCDGTVKGATFAVQAWQQENGLAFYEDYD